MNIFFDKATRQSRYFILSQEIKLTVSSEQGKEAVIAILDRDHFFGEGCMAGQNVRMSTDIVHTPSEIIKVDKSSIIKMMREDSEFSEFFVAHLLKRTIRLESDLIDQLFNSSEKRLARLLLLLANFGKDGKPEPVLAKISQESLADMIGTTRSRVSFFMNKFRRLGLIKYHGHIEVQPSLLSFVLHDIPSIKDNSED